MKIYIALLFVLWGVSMSSAQETSRLDSIKNILKHDKVAFEQFRSMGICRCIDTLFAQTNTTCITKIGRKKVKNSFFTDYYDNLSFQQYLLPNTVLVDSIKAALDQYYTETINQVIKTLRNHDEHFVIYRSPFLIAEQMYNDPVRLYAIYQQVIENNKSYYSTFVLDNSWLAIWRFSSQTLECPTSEQRPQ